MMNFDSESVEWKTLGELGKFQSGAGITKRDLVDEGFSAIHYAEIETYYSAYTDTAKSRISEALAKRRAKFGDVIIAVTGFNEDAVGKAVAWLGDTEVAVGHNAIFYSHEMNAKYVSYYFQTEHFLKQKRRFVTGSMVKHMSIFDFEKILIPALSLAQQEKIVSILDKFDTLTNFISEVLPREIKLRQQQYEYYREQLFARITQEEINNEREDFTNSERSDNNRA